MSDLQVARTKMLHSCLESHEQPGRLNLPRLPDPVHTQAKIYGFPCLSAKPFLYGMQHRVKSWQFIEELWINVCEIRRIAAVATEKIENPTAIHLPHLAHLRTLGLVHHCLWQLAWLRRWRTDLPRVSDAFHVSKQAAHSEAHKPHHWLPQPQHSAVDNATPTATDLWDQLLPQAEITLNLLRASRLNPKVSAWAQLHGEITTHGLNCNYW